MITTRGIQTGIRCSFCGRALASYVAVPGTSAHDVDCEVCGRYRISVDRETRLLRRQFSPRARTAHLRGIRSANLEGHRYSVDDGRAIK
jgi:hypothetical protein